MECSKQCGKPVTGIRYVVPEYKGGMKFRTPEAIDTALFESVARRLQLPLATVRQEPGKADIALVTIAKSDPLRRSATIIHTGYG